MKRPTSPGIEPLESRIAPASLFDIKGGIGLASQVIDLAKLVDPTATGPSSFRTVVEFQTNITAAGTPGTGVIRLELFDDKTPLTVQNFLTYVTNTIADNANNPNDYDGTYFHRLVGGFVLQGGGYNGPLSTNNLGPHVGTLFQVHNEFNDADAELDPVAGTLAMAKVGTTGGGGPHSATSEFFINYADNSSILDDQNGGFTVFGKVTQGMDIVNAMATLRRVSAGDLTGKVNTQQNPNADGIPTLAGEGVSPTANDLIKIVDARVIPATDGNANGYTFAATAAKLTGDDLLVLPSIVGGKLTLDYLAGKAGTSTVTVTATKAGSPTITDEFIVTILPNMVAKVNSSLTSIISPGQKGTVNVSITNNGAGIAKGDVKVRLFLSEINATGVTDADIASGFTLEQNTDIEITADAAKPISLASGGTLSLATKFAISPTAAAQLKTGSDYRVLAYLESTTGTIIQELFTDDNVGNIFDKVTNTFPQSEFKNIFGSLPDGRKGVSLTTKDFRLSGQPDGNDVTFIIKGPGQGVVDYNADGTIKITLSGTTTASSFSVKAAKGITPKIGELHVNDVIGKVILKNAHVLSHLSVSGGAKSLILGDLGAAMPTHTSNLSIGGFANLKTTITAGAVRDYSIDASAPIKSLTVKSWENLNSQEHEILELSGIEKLAVAGDFQADILDDGTTAISSFTVKGTIKDSTISTAALVEKLVVSNVAGSNFLLGDIAQVAALATTKGTLAFGTVSDSSLEAAYPITKLTALAWTDTAASTKESLTFHGLGTAKITGELGANITELSGLTVKDITVGAINGTTLTTKTVLTKLTAGNTIGANFILGDPVQIAALATVKGALKFGSVSDSSIDAAYPITSLTALGWMDTAASTKETLKFQGLGSLSITGDLEANITERSALAMGAVTVSGSIKNSVIKSTGDITAIKAATFEGASVFAGVSAKPTALADLNTAKNIGSITATAAFLNSVVVGKEIAAVAVSGVTGAGAAKFGFYADAIKSYVRATGPTLTSLTAAGESDPVGENYQVLVF